ncbi:cupin domain-containing protein [Sessilibacter corallicola]|uniref:Cupin type-2 domain-containing protein n=1 Tax=Sessilibacter corallicola TaxID=2904075 RepID=A0ABQ0A4W4_9GAMM|nr:cupin domain-containing protein [Sessilibacter corallicola]MCE2026706.1 cupin domain-containing protein [Sessilibacter corallicola]
MENETQLSPEITLTHPTSGKTMYQLPRLDCGIIHAGVYEMGVTKTQVPHVMGTGGKIIDGITPDTVGAREIHFALYEIAPKDEDGPVHIHEHETSGYVLSGRLALLWGDALENYEVAEAGSFVFVPPNVPHFIDNPSDTEPCAVLLTRYVSETNTTAVILPEMEKLRLSRRKAVAS